MKEIKSVAGVKKDVTILNRASALGQDINGFEFQPDLYKKDFKEIMEGIFPQYNISLEIIDDEVRDFMFDDARGDITEEEKESLTDAIYSDSLISLHAEDKYYIFNPKAVDPSDDIDDNSKKYYHKDDSYCIINGIYDLSEFEQRELTSVELYFLKYIATIKSNPLEYISGDWTYDYHLNYKDILNQFVGQELVKVEDLSLSEKINKIHTVEDLRGILKFKGITIRGNKPILIQRMIENSDENELKDYRNERYIRYNLTEKGKELTENINPSITRDMEMEDRCFNLVLNNLIEEAYNIISNFRAGKTFSKIEYKIIPKISKSESKEIMNEIDNIKVVKYKRLRKVNLNLPKEIEDKEEEIIACIIVGDMLGCRYFSTANLIRRLAKINIEDRETEKQVNYASKYLINNLLDVDVRLNNPGDSSVDEGMAKIDNKIKELILSGKKINAIKLCRTVSGLELKEAKEYIDDLSKKLKS